MKVWKHALAALLAFIMLNTSANVSMAAGTLDTATNIWKATAADIVAENYGLSEKETAALTNGAVQRGKNYQAAAPYSNTNDEADNLVEVDYLGKIVYAENYSEDGYTWLPVKAVLMAEGEEKESFSLAQGTCFYNNREYNASSQAFTYDGNNYTIWVTYELWVSIGDAEQERLLQIPAVLGGTVKTLETTLKNARLNLLNFGKLLPSLKEMMSLPSAFDPKEDAELLAAVDALYEEYTKEPDNPGLDLYALCEAYRSCGSGRLAFAFEKGTQIQEVSAELYANLKTLYGSQHLFDVIGELLTTNIDLYKEVRFTKSYLQKLLPTAEKLMDEENWPLLQEGVREAVLLSGYSETDFSALETAAYALRSETFTAPESRQESLLAASAEVSCPVNIYEIRVTASAQVASEPGAERELTALTSYYKTIKLLEGTTPEEIRQAVAASGAEEYALEQWNALSSLYQIHSGNYTRTETEITEALNRDIPDYSISYTPNRCTVKTNYTGNMTVPYGYQLELPVSTEEESSYDYRIEAEDGSSEIYNQGTCYTVTGNVTVTRSEGSTKAEYRLYDFLAQDRQYALSDAVQKILLSSALDSPTLKIRIPDASLAGEPVQTEDGYMLEVSDFPSGILGMTWEPYEVRILNGSTIAETIRFDADGRAFWSTENYTAIDVQYRLKIEKVKNGILNRPLDEESDVLYALNLPYELVQSVTEQNSLLSGSEGMSAKAVYQKMESVKKALTKDNLEILEGAMQGEEGRNAVIRLCGSEAENISGINGEKLGAGGWSSTSNELALYKYLALCANADWSLAVYYEKGYYGPLAEQAGILADCLEAIMQDESYPDLRRLLGDQAGELETLLPELRSLSRKLKGPHAALKVQDAGFPALIGNLLAAEGQTKQYTESNGVYAYISLRQTPEQLGLLTVSIEVGDSLPRTEYFTYDLEQGASGWQYTVEESFRSSIDAAVERMEAELGMTEEEKAYYDRTQTGEIQVGMSLGRSAAFAVKYVPKTYSVTIQGVPNSQYRATFRYGEDFVIELPAKSQSTSAESYYRYVIDGNVRRVDNGTTGSYRFEKPDLKRLFPTGNYEMIREELPVLPGVQIAPEVSLLYPDIVRGSQIDTENRILIIDGNPKGILVSEYEMTVDFVSAEGEITACVLENTNKGTASEYLGNGSTVTVTAEDENHEEYTEKWTVILAGDANGSGKLDSNDAMLLMKNYLGTAAVSEKLGSVTAKLSADMNGNGNSCDSNDALLITKKYMHWDDEDESTRYRSMLAK